MNDDDEIREHNPLKIVFWGLVIFYTVVALWLVL